MKQRFAYQSLHTILSRGFILAAGFGVSILTARFLGPENKGLVSLFLAAPLMILPLCELGIRQSAAHLLGQGLCDRLRIAATLNFLFLTNTALSVSVVLFSYWCAGLIPGRGYLVPLLFAAIVPPVLFESYYGGILLASRRVDRLNCVRLLDRVALLLLLALFLPGLNLGIVGVGASYILAPAVSVILLMRWLGDFVKAGVRLHRDVGKLLLSRGVLFALSLFILQMNYRLDMLILGKLQNEYSVGIYSVGVSLCELLKEIPLAIGLVLFSHSTNWQQGEATAAFGRVTFLCRLVFTTTCVLAVFMALASAPLVKLVYGGAFAESGQVILCLMPGVIMLSAMLVLNLFCVGQGRPGLLLRASIPALALNVLLNLYMIPRFDYLGAALSSSISYSAGTLVFLISTGRAYGASLPDFLCLRKSDVTTLWEMLRNRAKGTV